MNYLNNTSFVMGRTLLRHPVTYCVFKRLLHPSVTQKLWFQDHPKDGYSKAKEKLDKMSKTEIIRMSITELKKEVHKWKAEMKEKWEMDPVMAYRKGETDVIFRFATKEELDNWICTSDSDHNEGHSTSTLTSTQMGTGLFSGELVTKFKSDGRIKQAGYCNICTKRVTKSFLRDSYYDWGPYTHLVLKVRGDGRAYMMNLHVRGYYDVFWNDMYQYVLHTRGGPYWQITKIPFSKFFLSSKGKIQDKQYQIPLYKISNVGITAADKIEGSFSLEIDYIGIEYDPDHAEDFAYELYQTDKYICNT